MTTVTVEEARANLPGLLRRIADGEELVITEGGKWVALLAPPPDPPPTEAEIAASRDRAEAAIQEMFAAREQRGRVSRARVTIQELIEEQRGPDE